MHDLVREGSHPSNEMRVSRKRSTNSKENRLTGIMDDWPSKFKNILAESNLKQETFAEDVWVTDKTAARKEPTKYQTFLKSHSPESEKKTIETHKSEN